MKKFLLLISFSFFIHTLSFAQEKPVFPEKCTNYKGITSFFTGNKINLKGKELTLLEKLNEIKFTDSTITNISELLNEFRSMGLDSIPTYEKDSITKDKLICKVAQSIHSHFIKNPEMLCETGQDEAYTKYSGGSSCSAYILGMFPSSKAASNEEDTTGTLPLFDDINKKLEKLENNNLMLLIGIALVFILSIISLIFALKNRRKKGGSTTKKESPKDNGNTNLTISPAIINKLFKDKIFDDHLQTWLSDKGYNNKGIVYKEQDIINIIKEYLKDNPTNTKEVGQQQKKAVDYNIQYSGIPQKGEFSDREMKDDFKGGMTFYEIRISKRNPSEAEFTLVEDAETQKRAMDLADTYLKPACELKGRGDIKNARGITKITPGKIIKSGVNWKITKKATIEFV